jgi:serine/threonine-protein kinase
MPIVGDVLAGRYRIDGLLGAGGMASVYSATDLRLERPVAIKVLSPNLAADAGIAERFEREARALAAAAHPSVVAVFDVEPGDPSTGREPFYVMELCDGGSLADRLATHGRLEPAELVATIGAVADGLAELHRRGVVHRDIKPANIVYAGDRPKLADFGLARADQPDLTTLTAAGTTVGTLAFLAPEVLGGAPATAASDVYALGVAAFQGLTGRLPRPAASMSEIIENRAAMSPPISSIAPELGQAFDPPIAGALAVDPTERPSPVEFADALDDALAAPLGTGAASAVEADTAPIPVPAPEGPAAAVDPAADTLAAIPVVPAQATSRPPDLLHRPGLLVLMAFALVVAALAGLSTLLGPRRDTGSPAPSAPLVVVPSQSPSLPPSPSPTPPPTPTPTATPGPAAEALAALDRVDAAIAAAKGGGDGLKGKEANELERLAATIRQQLQSGDFEEAASSAHELRERAAKVDHDLDRERRQRIEDAIDALIQAIPGD